MGFSNNFKVQLKVSHYSIRTIETLHDLKRVLEFRTLCFEREFFITPIELEAEHLIVEDMNNHNKIVGSYRMISTHTDLKLETSETFPIEFQKYASENSLELSWACTHPDYRNGDTIMILWRGLSEYIKLVRPRYLIGTASIKKDEFKWSDLGAIQNPSFRRRLPGLIRAYLLAGVLICGSAVFDPEFDCYDYFTVLDISQTTVKAKKHFNL